MVFGKILDKVFEIAFNMRKIDSCFYGEVLNELEHDYIIQEFWGESIAKSNGDENKAKSLYVERRARSIEALYYIQSNDFTNEIEFIKWYRTRTYKL